MANAKSTITAHKRVTKKRPTAGRPSSANLTRNGVAHGKARADAIFNSRQRFQAASKGLPGANGVLIAEGDSWFDYPFHDVLSTLEHEFN